MKTPLFPGFPAAIIFTRSAYAIGSDEEEAAPYAEHKSTDLGKLQLVYE